MQKSELLFFKEQLQERREQIVKNIDAAYAELDQLNGCELKDEGDYSATYDHVSLDANLILKQQQELREIDNALSKIVTGTYGSCEMCDDDIGFARLKVKPHARYCIHCRPLAEQSASETLLA